jgi:hypothetical protein
MKILSPAFSLILFCFFEDAYKYFENLINLHTMVLKAHHFLGVVGISDSLLWLENFRLRKKLKFTRLSHGT